MSDKYLDVLDAEIAKARPYTSASLVGLLYAKELYLQQVPKKCDTCRHTDGIWCKRGGGVGSGMSCWDAGYPSWEAIQS